MIATLAAAALAVSLAPRGPAGGGAVPPAAGALLVRADPPSVVLGPGARATIVVEGAADATPWVATSIGRIAEVRAIAPGSFAAEWVAPEQAYPQVAIVSAVAGERSGWAALPLVGTGFAVARAVPGSLIRVTIGDRSFGPVRTDPSGEARIRVVVPPGISKARHGDADLDLNIPPSRHVHLAADRVSAGAERESAVALHLFAVDAAGVARRGAPVALAVSEGRIEGLEEIAPGWWTARWRLAPGPAGVARARASLRDDGGLEAAVDVARPAGPAARLEILPSVLRTVAGETGRVPLRIRIADAAGNAVSPPAPPRVETSFGALDAVREVAPGTFEVGVAIPDRLEGRRRAVVTAVAGGVAGRVELELAPGSPQRLVLAAPDAPLVADGAREARLRAEVLDRFGNEVEGVVPTVSASAGAEVGSERDAGGGWTLRYRPARVRSDARHDVVVRAGPLDAKASLSVVAPRPVLIVAPKLGFAASAGGLRSAYAAVEACGWTPWRDGRVGIALEAGTFRLDRIDRVTTDAAAVTLLRGESRYVPVVASALWDGGRLGRGRWWVAAGAGVAYVSSSLVVDAEPALRDGGWVGVAQGTVAWGMRLAGGTAFAEARVAWHGDPALETLHGALAALVLAVGWRWVAY